LKGAFIMDLRDIKEFLKDTLKYVIVIAVVFLIAMYVVSFQQVIGPSMQNTLLEDDVVVLNKLVYRYRDLERGEIVVIKHDDKYLIKRVIGLPGETVEFKDNKLYINNEAYVETYTSSDSRDWSLSDINVDGSIPEGSYLVLGDNRSDSMDGRDFGLITKDEVIGKVILRIYPLNSIQIMN
jgi:signal peptidase I